MSVLSLVIPLSPHAAPHCRLHTGGTTGLASPAPQSQPSSQHSSLTPPSLHCTTSLFLAANISSLRLQTLTIIHPSSHCFDLLIILRWRRQAGRGEPVRVGRKYPCATRGGMIIRPLVLGSDSQAQPHELPSKKHLDPPQPQRNWEAAATLTFSMRSQEVSRQE